MKVAFVTSEATPFCKTGGLADVSAALPRALCRLAGGPELHLFLPLYREARESIRRLGLDLVDSGVNASVRGSVVHPPGRFFTLTRPGEPTAHLLDCPVYFDREGLYGPWGSADYLDNPRRFAFFCRAVVAHAPALMGGTPDVYHLNDWQAALVAALVGELRGRDAPATVLSIHNLAYQGNFDKAAMPELGLDWSLFTAETLEFYDRVSLLKGGIVFSDVFTTVSPTYAEEIQTPEGGAGLDGVLRVHRERLIGILNGIDTDEWNPARDGHLRANYNAEDLSGKKECKQALLAEMGLPADDSTPLIAIVSRLVFQKGIDMLAEIAPQLPELGARLVLLGSGEAALEQRFRELALDHPEHIAVRLGYDEALSHRIEAGADLFVMPSRYEPCGLNQMYSMVYGTVPVARSVGGLADTIVNVTEDTLADGTATGFLYDDLSPEALLENLERALLLYRERPEAWDRLRRAGMTRDFSWARAAARYMDAYGSALERRRVERPTGK